MGKVFGERKSVVRGGFGMFYSKLTSEDTDRRTGPTAGFTSTASTGLTNCMVSAAPGANCNVTTADPALSTFRVGVDGTIPIPTYAATAGSPYIPGPNYGELISFGVSPDLVSPRIYSADLTLQRELGRGVFMEVAYNGRWGRTASDKPGAELQSLHVRGSSMTKTVVRDGIRCGGHGTAKRNHSVRTAFF